MYQSKAISAALMGREISSSQKRTVSAICYFYGTNDLKECAKRLAKETFLFLGATENRDIYDLSPLYGYANLSRLHIITEKAIDLKEIGNIPNLTELGISGGNVQNIDLMSEYPLIKSLTIAECALKYIPRLAFKHVEDLNISNNQISSLECVYNSSNIQKICAYKNQLKALTSAGYLPSIKILDVSTNLVESISGIETWGNLKEITCQRCQVKAVNPLASCKKLTVIDIHENQIEDVDCLRELKNIRYLFMAGNPLKSIRCLENMAKLKMVSVPEKYRDAAKRLGQRMGFEAS